MVFCLHKKLLYFPSSFCFQKNDRSLFLTDFFPFTILLIVAQTYVLSYLFQWGGKKSLIVKDQNIFMSDPSHMFESVLRNQCSQVCRDCLRIYFCSGSPTLCFSLSKLPVGFTSSFLKGFSLRGQNLVTARNVSMWGETEGKGFWRSHMLHDGKKNLKPRGDGCPGLHW